MNRFFSLCVALAVVLSVCIGSTISFAAADDSVIINGVSYKRVEITPQQIKAMFDAGDFKVSFNAYVADDGINLRVYTTSSNYTSKSEFETFATTATVEGNMVYFWAPYFLRFTGNSDSDDYEDCGSIDYGITLPFDCGRFVSDGTSNLMWFDHYGLPPIGDYVEDTFFEFALKSGSTVYPITTLNPTVSTVSPIPTAVSTLFSSFNFSSYSQSVGVTRILVAPNHQTSDVDSFVLYGYSGMEYYENTNAYAPLCFSMSGFYYYVPDVVVEHTHSAGSVFYADDDYHWRVCSCGEVMNKALHSGGTATVDKKAICSTCKFSYGDFATPEHQHTLSTNWYTDENYHWKKCTTCGEVLYYSEHSGGTATTEEKAVCSVCNVAYGELLPPSSSGDSDSPTYADLVEEYLNKVTDPSPEAQEQVNQLRDELESAGEDLRNAANGLTVPVPDVDDFYEGLPDEALGGFGYWATYVLGPMMNLKFVELLLIGLLTLTGIKLILFGSGPH